MITDRKLIGRGLSFPFSANSVGTIETAEEIERINQSLFMIFETPKGSRLMMPEFGSDLHKYRFDPLDDALIEGLKYTITKDIEKWEPRVIVNEVSFLTDEDNSRVYVSVDYTIINTTVTANYVYPYQISSYDTLDISY